MTKPSFQRTRAALEAEVLASIGDDGSEVDPKRFNGRVLAHLLRAWQADHTDERLWAYLWPTMTAYTVQGLPDRSEVDDYLQRLVLLMAPYLERADPDSATTPGYLARAIRLQAVSVRREAMAYLKTQGADDVPEAGEEDDEKPVIGNAVTLLQDLGAVCHAMAEALPEHWADHHQHYLGAVAAKSGLAQGRVRTLYDALRPTLQTIMGRP